MKPGGLSFIRQRGAAVDERAGGKARGLAAAERAGLPVPPWFVVPAGIAAGDDELQRAIDDAVAGLCPDGALVAVRSSAIGEDGTEASFAGQLGSVLNVGPSDVFDRVRAVQRSGQGDSVLAYRAARGLTGRPDQPAVLVQRMLRSRVSGVAFSADPVSGRRAVAVVSAVRGFGTALVAGEVEGDTWHVAGDGAIVERTIVRQTRMHVADVCAASGVRAVVIGEPGGAGAALSDDEVRAVAELARRSARQLGRPQDIEWAYEDGRLFLLQSRPITTLAGRCDPDGPLTIWDNSNLVESYSGITSPLTFSFAAESYEYVYREFCRLLRVPEDAIARHDTTFRNMLGYVRGRLYYNLLNWHRVLSLLPGYSLNRAFMEQMMGVGDPLPPGLAEQIAAAGRRGTLVDLWHVSRTICGLAAAHLTLERRIRRFYRRLDDALGTREVALERLRSDELVAHYRNLRDRLLRSWDAPLVNDLFAMIFYGLLRRAAAGWCHDAEGTLQNDLIGGEGGMVSAEPATRLRRLASLASVRPGLVDRLVAGSRAAIEEEVPFAPGFAAAVQAYLEKFGDRSVNELKLESLTLHDDPLPLYRSIGTLARHMTLDRQQGDQAPPATPGGRLREAAARRVSAALAGHPVRRLAFGWILEHARARVRDRENLRLERTRLFARVRRIFVELGQRLHADRWLDDPRDIFYLEIDEVLAFVEGRATTTNLRGLAALRRDEQRAWESQPEPDARFETRGAVYQGNDFRRTAAGALQAGEHRRGLGCSPGRVRGPVRVVADPRDVASGGRAILVARHTDPGWVIAFPSALGILVERGSLLSHAAIVARELGIPAVVSVPGLTSWLQDGDWVEFDGTTGAISRLASPRADGAAVA